MLKLLYSIFNIEDPKHRKQIEDLQNKLEKTLKDRNRYRWDMAVTKTVNVGKSHQIEVLEKKLRQKDEKIAKLEEAQDSLRLSKTVSVNRIGVLEEKLRLKNEEIAKLEKQVKDIDSKYKTEKSNTKYLHSVCLGKEEKQRLKDEEAAELEKEIREKLHFTKIENVNKSNRIGVLEEKLRQKDEAHKKSQQEVMRLSYDKNRHRASIANLEAKVTELHKVNSELRDKVYSKEKKVKELEDEFRRALEANLLRSPKRTDEQIIRENNTRLVNKVAYLETDKRALKEEILSLKKQLNYSNENTRRLVDKVAFLETDKRALKKEIAKLEKQVKDIDSKYKTEKAKARWRL